MICKHPIPGNIVQTSIRTKPVSSFAYFLLKLFDTDTVTRLIGEYGLGVTKSRDTIFYQIDGKGRCRTGKVMKYISPEYWDNVDALIRELDLELVSVTRTIFH